MLIYEIIFRFRFVRESLGGFITWDRKVPKRDSPGPDIVKCL